jgi:hypothetical protein
MRAYVGLWDSFAMAQIRHGSCNSSESNNTLFRIDPLVELDPKITPSHRPGSLQAFALQTTFSVEFFLFHPQRACPSPVYSDVNDRMAK